MFSGQVSIIQYQNTPHSNTIPAAIAAKEVVYLLEIPENTFSYNGIIRENLQ
jgi:hypothetical protein